MHFLIEDLYR